LYADTVDVIEASPDRRPTATDWRCGGNVLAHVAYERQLRLKGEIVKDAFGRIGRVPLPSAREVIGSPEQGYRMRARLHAHDGRLGFFREGSHDLCDAAQTGQLLPETGAWIASVQNLLRNERLTGLAGMEFAESIVGDERACHLELQPGADSARFARLAEAAPLAGLSARRADRAGVERLAGNPWVTDVIHGREGDTTTALRLRRDVRAFFQANRFLLERLVQHVVTLVPAMQAVDLYAGVGLFGLSLAAAGAERVTLVEGDAVSGADLRRNAEPFGKRVRVVRTSVEDFLRRPGSVVSSVRSAEPTTFIVDPPRTGISKDALTGIVRKRPSRIVYVSCDVATLARDARVLLDAGYELDGLRSFDLFPNTAHVETIATFGERRVGRQSRDRLAQPCRPHRRTR
jgi:23S rRNA (uracil1939-C5)-methyltransferase